MGPTNMILDAIKGLYEFADENGRDDLADHASCIVFALALDRAASVVKCRQLHLLPPER